MAGDYVKLYPFEKDLGSVVAGVPVNFQAELDAIQMQMKGADKRDIPGMKEYEAYLRGQIGQGKKSDTSNPYPLLPQATGDWLATGRLSEGAPIQQVQDSVTDYVGEKIGNISMVALGGAIIVVIIGLTAYNSIRGK